MCTVNNNSLSRMFLFTICKSLFNKYSNYVYVIISSNVLTMNCVAIFNVLHSLRLRQKLFQETFHTKFILSVNNNQVTVVKV